MKKLYPLVVCLVVLGLVLGSFGCAKPAPPTPTPAPTPAPTPTPAPSPEKPYFEGKTISIIVAHTPGGGTDLISRLYAKFLPKYLPGKPTIVVRNMPGGQATIGANYVYFSKPDGLTLLTSSGSIAMADLMKKAALKFSLSEMTATIGVAMGNVYYFKPDIFDKPEDIVNAKGIRYGHTSGGVSTMFACSIEMIGIPTEKVIFAYGGSGDARRAFLSGEINGSSETSAGYAVNLFPYIEKGEAKVLMQTGIIDEQGNIVRTPAFPDYYTAAELYEKIYGKSPSGMAYEGYRAIVASSETINKPLFLHVGTPDSVIKAYWDAAEKMIKDPEFVKIADNLLGKGAPWYAGESFAKLHKREFGMKPEVRDWIIDLMSTKYGVVFE